MSGSFLVILIQFIIILGLLLFFHEFGHFIVARLFKIEVEEFGFGFPPRLARLFTLGGTEFTLNWIPFGAFVRPKGENDPDVPGGLASASPWTRLAVLFGGPVMNILTGIIVFAVMFMKIGAPEASIVEIIQVNANSPAAIAGLQARDVIQSINGQTIDSTQKLQQIIQSNLGVPVSVTVERNGAPVQLTLTPRKNPPENEGPVGIVMGNPYRPVSLAQASSTAVLTAYDQARQLFLLPVQLIEGRVSADQSRLVGPKGMFDIYSEAVKRDSQAETSPVPQPAVNVLWIVGSISIALGLTNLLPIPALDGGRILFVLPEIILRRRVPAQYENLVHLIGFAALLLLMGYITIQDFAHPIQMP